MGVPFPASTAPKESRATAKTAEVAAHVDRAVVRREREHGIVGVGTPPRKRAARRYRVGKKFVAPRGHDV